jgi:CDP-diacylglycerol--glycerol-3-phosphate 3-phosphatidyltransferase
VRGTEAWNDHGEMNLPNALSAGRIVVTPLVAVLPMFDSWPLRLAAFVLFLVAAITDYIDGYLARSRHEITDLGKMLDPLADKMLLIGTFVPMFLLAKTMPFRTPIGDMGLPLWIVLVVLGREVFMTVFRQVAKNQGVVIAAIRSAKWKTGFQLVWQGSAYFWFWAVTAAIQHDAQNNSLWKAFALFNGTVGVITMVVAVFLTIYSLAIYMRSFSSVLAK